MDKPSNKTLMYIALGGAALVGVYLLFKKGAPMIGSVTDSINKFGGQAKGLIGDMPGMGTFMGKQEAQTQHASMAARPSTKPVTQASGGAFPIQSTGRGDPVGKGTFQTPPSTGAGRVGANIAAKTASGTRQQPTTGRRFARPSTPRTTSRPSASKGASRPDLRARAGRPRIQSGRAGSSARYSNRQRTPQRSFYAR